MMKNIFESRKLTDFNDDACLGTNLDEFGRFYAQYIKVGDKFEADNVEWILNELFPALQDYVYDGDEQGIMALGDDDVRLLSRAERVGIYEMITTALALGWFRKKDAKA